MTVFVENLNGYGANTDIGAVGSFVRNTGTVGSAIVNADGFFDIVSVSPNSKVSYPVGELDNSMECTTAQTTVVGNYYPIGVSVTSGGNGLYARIVSGNNIELAKIVSDVITTLVGSGGTIINATYATGTRATGDRLKVQRIGDTTKVFFNDVEKFSVDVSGQGVSRTTNCGMYIRSTTGTDLFTQYTLEGISSYAITDINGSDPVSGDTSGNTRNTTGFSETITSVTVGGLACTSVTGGLTSGTFTVPPPVHLSTYPEIGVNQNVIVSSATQSATLAKSFVLTNWTVTSLVDPEVVDLTYPTAHFDVTPVTGDLQISKTADVISTAPNGGVTVADPIYTIIMHWKRSTGVMYIYGFTISAEGVVNRGLTAIGLTSVGLTQAGLTAVGL